MLGELAVRHLAAPGKEDLAHCFLEALNRRYRGIIPISLNFSVAARDRTSGACGPRHSDLRHKHRNRSKNTDREPSCRQQPMRRTQRQRSGGLYVLSSARALSISQTTLPPRIVCIPAFSFEAVRIRPPFTIQTPTSSRIFQQVTHRFSVWRADQNPDYFLRALGLHRLNARGQGMRCNGVLKMARTIQGLVTARTASLIVGLGFVAFTAACSSVLAPGSADPRLVQKSSNPYASGSCFYSNLSATDRTAGGRMFHWCGPEPRALF
jgi:hypothetical protein